MAAPFSPRARPGPHRPTPRSLLHPAACVDVQWRFLPPQPSQQTPFHDPNLQAQPKLSDVYDNAQAREELRKEQARLRASQEAAELHDQRVLYDLLGETQRQALLDRVMAEMEDMALVPVKRFTSQRQHPRQKPSSPEASPTMRRASVLSAKMKPSDVELLPQRRLSALGTQDDDANDDWANTSLDWVNCDDDEVQDGVDDIPELRFIRERHRRRLAGSQPTDLDLRTNDLQIQWQKSDRVRLALDLPSALLRGRDGEQHNIGQSPRDPLSSLFPVSEGEQSHHHLSAKTLSPVNKRAQKSRQTKGSQDPISQSPRLQDLQSPRARRVKKAHYGSWYVPRSEWWSLHRTEQQALREAYPDDQQTPVERHVCERESPNQRHNKDSAVLQPTPPHAWPSLLRTPSPVASPRTSLMRPPLLSCSLPSRSQSVRSPRALPPPSTPPSTSGAPSRLDTTSAPDAITQRADVLQQEIPQAYIAREYRSYLVAKGARVPAYLNY